MEKLCKEILKCNLCEKKVVDREIIERLKNERHAWNLEDPNAVAPCTGSCNGELILIKIEEL